MYDLDKNIEILKNSKSKLVELDKMNNFFKILDLSSVLINTSLIISYFESNIEREDLSKLELFNLQYTDSLLELLRKVKSNKEREIAGVTVKYNRFIYEQKRLVYNNPNLDEEFVISKKLHELEISILFENFFNNIEYKDFNKLISFHKKYSSRYFYNIDDIKELANKGVKKILILGEKDFGYNKGKADLNSRKHKHWRWFLSDLFKLFEVASFDNLALEQLKPERFLTKKDFDTFNQGEYSMYINAVEGYFSPSSRSNYIFNWGMISIKDFFKNKESLMNDCKVSLSIGMFDSSVYLQGTGI